MLVVVDLCYSIVEVDCLLLSVKRLEGFSLFFVCGSSLIKFAAQELMYFFYINIK